MSVLNVLTLDLDWFNFAIVDGSANCRKWVGNPNDLQKTKCRVETLLDKIVTLKLPKNTLFIKEHHFLYPICSKIMKSRNRDSVSIVNIDEHHDFYGLDTLNGKVDCANFFGHMLVDNVLSEYTWIVGDNDNVFVAENELHRDIRRLKDKQYHDSNISVHSKKFLSSLSSKKFDVFVVCHSPFYCWGSINKFGKKWVCDYLKKKGFHFHYISNSGQDVIKKNKIQTYFSGHKRIV